MSSQREDLAVPLQQAFHQQALPDNYFRGISATAVAAAVNTYCQHQLPVTPREAYQVLQSHEVLQSVQLVQSRSLVCVLATPVSLSGVSSVSHSVLHPRSRIPSNHEAFGCCFEFVVDEFHSQAI